MATSTAPTAASSIPSSGYTPCPSHSLHQLKVTLKGSLPPIWRRVLVPSSTSLTQLHRVLQALFDFTDCHHHFYCIPVKDSLFDDKAWRTFITHPLSYREDKREREPGEEDERLFQLRRIIPKPGDFIVYLYDTGDNWVHHIEVEKVAPVSAFKAARSRQRGVR